MARKGPVRSHPFWKPFVAAQRERVAPLGVTEPDWHIKARYSAGITFHACGLFVRTQVPLLSASEGEMTGFPLHQLTMNELSAPVKGPLAHLCDTRGSSISPACGLAGEGALDVCRRDRADSLLFLGRGASTAIKI